MSVVSTYTKTQELVEKAGLKWDKPPGRLKEEKWFDSVKNPQTGDFFQWSDLKLIAGIDPPDELAAKRKYPIKTVNCIIRVQTTADNNKEWIMSRQTWTGLDRNGNEVSKSWDDLETWRKPVLKYESRPVNPKDRFSKIERKITGVSSEVRMFDKPFTAKAFDELYAMRGPMCGLIIMRVDQNGEKIGNPYSMTKYEDFRSRPFDELYEWPRHQRLRSKAS
jgi:hypothetical protein